MRRIVVLLLAPVFAASLYAGTNTTELVSRDSPEDIFTAGHMEVESFSGVAASPVVGPKRRSYTYTDSEYRVGWMLNRLCGRGILAGDFEVLAGFGGGAILRGHGNGYAASNVMLRYNFAQPGARFVPYAQAATGIFYSDIANDRRQTEVGNNIEADLRGSVGLRSFLNRHWAINVESYFHHVSNAGTSSRNAGINAAGGLIGLAHVF